MRKFSLLLTALLLLGVFTFAQDKNETVTVNKAELIKILKNRTIDPQPITVLPTEAELFNNGSPINDPGNGPNGSDGSVLQVTTLGLNTLGGGWQQSAGNSIADDFEIVGDAWNIDSIKVYGYQTNGGIPSTFDGLFVQIWDGEPYAAGSNVVFGDLTTNMLGDTYWTGAYRYSDNNVGTARAIHAVVAHTFASALSLNPGTYWLEVSATGTAASGPWMPPITITGQANTGNAVQTTSTGTAPFTDSGTSDPQGMGFTVYGTTGAPVGPGPATDPIPADGTVGVPASGNTAGWTNPAATLTGVSVYFGMDAGLVGANDPSTLAYDGAPVNSLSLASVEPLSYNTDYYWRVVTTDATGSSNSPVWGFKTEEDPAIVTLFMDDFEAGAGNWTITNDGGTCVWEILADPFPNSYTLPATAAGNLLAADSDECGSGTTLLSTAQMTNPVDATMYGAVELSFDQDWRDLGGTATVEVSVDGGSSWTSVWSQTASVRQTTEVIDISAQAALSEVWVRFVSMQDGWHWWWVVDNVKIRGYDVVPVELTNFTYNVSEDNVVLNWATATETNNSHFNVERSSDNVDFTTLARVEGNGTTTQTSTYSYLDNTVNGGSYYYRLKQVDFDGSYSYSDVIEVDLGVPTDFNLAQNFPNPFNPTTTINFALPVDAKVNVSVYNTLGQQVAQLANENYSAGRHEVNFNAGQFSSGVYFYSIEATGVDGAKFVSTMKMMLMK